MRRLAALTLAVLFAIPVLEARPPAASQPAAAGEGHKLQPIVPMAAVSPSHKLTGEAKVRYLMRQLDLNLKQRRYARELIASIYNDDTNPRISLAEVHAIVAEIEKARAAGDKKREQELGQQLREMAQNADRDREFLTNMETVLTDQQKKLLKKAIARVKANPTGALRPLDVIRAARALDLSDAQKTKLDKIIHRLRDNLAHRRQVTDAVRYQTINGLLYSIKHMLTPEQEKAFDLAILRLRCDLLGDLRARLPHKGPHKAASQPAGGQAPPAGNGKK